MFKLNLIKKKFKDDLLYIDDVVVFNKVKLIRSFYLKKEKGVCEFEKGD